MSNNPLDSEWVPPEPSDRQPPLQPLAYEYRAEPGYPGARGDRNIAKMAAEGWELTSRVPVSKKLEQLSFRRVKYQAPAGPPGMQYEPPQGQPWPPPQQLVQVKRRRGCLWWIGALVVAGIVAAAIGIGTSQSTSHTYEYRVTGSGAGTATISYGSSSGISQVTEALPWSTSFTSKGFDAASVVAQRGIDSGDGDIGCQILVDGVVKTDQRSSGQYAVVTCSASSEG